MTNTNHIYLCYTNLLLIISILYLLFNGQKNKPWIEYVLAMFLVATIICSQLFWKNPIQQSTIHKIDAIVAKIVISSFIIYTLLYKYKFGFLIVLLAIAVSFCLSNHYSKKEWCCNNHIFCHGLLHFFVSLLYSILFLQF